LQGGAKACLACFPAASPPPPGQFCVFRSFFWIENSAKKIKKLPNNKTYKQKGLLTYAEAEAAKLVASGAATPADLCYSLQARCGLRCSFFGLLHAVFVVFCGSLYKT
jgi:hypothetical protein